MKARITALFLFLLLVPSATLFANSGVSAEDGDGQGTYSELSRELYFPQFEDIRDGYWWYYEEEGRTFHSNGLVYRIDKADGYITVPTVKIEYGRVIGEEYEIDFAEFDLNLPRYDGWRLDGMVMKENDRGQLISFIYWEEDVEDRFTGAFLRFDLNSTGYPSLVSVSTVDFQISADIEEMRIFDMGDEMVCSLEDQNDDLLIICSNGGSKNISLGWLSRPVPAAFDGEILIYWMDPKGDMVLTTLDEEMNTTSNRTLVDIGPGQGLDMVFDIMVVGERVGLINYEDETYNDVYSSLKVITLDSSLEIIGDETLQFPDDMLITGHYPAFIYDDNIAFISGYLNRIYFYNSLTYEIKYEGLLEEFYARNDYDYYMMGPNDIDDQDITVEYVSGKPALLLEVGYNEYGTMFTDHSSIPEFGWLGFTGDVVIEDVTSVVNRDITVEGNLTLRDCEIHFMDYIEINVQGRLIIEGSSLFWDRRDDEGNIIVSGTIVIRNSYIENGVRTVTNEAEAEIYGDPFPYQGDSFWVYMELGNVKMIGGTIEDFRDIRYRYDFLIRTDSNAYYDSQLEFVNYTIKDSDTFIDHSGGRVIFRDSELDGIYGTDHKGIRFSTLDGCTITNSSGLSGLDGFLIRDCLFKDEIDIYVTENGGEIISSNFENCIEPFEEMDNVELTLTDCEFINCPDAITSYSSNLNIISCGFYDTPFPILLTSMDGFNISGCEFQNFSRAITLDENVLEDEYQYEYIIRDNVFQEGNATIFIEDIYDPYRDLMRGFVKDTEYDEDGTEFEVYTLRFLDARYNTFMGRNLDEVALSLSPMIYFLPYFDSSGNLVSTEDNDMDGMNDEWEIENGFRPDHIADRYMDADLDRYSNYEEYMEGTDPNDADSNPGIRVRRRIVIFQVVLIFIPIMILVCYLYYFQVALYKEKRRKFMKKYWRYKAQRDINKRVNLQNEDKMHPSSSNLPMFKVKADEIEAPPKPEKLPPAKSMGSPGGGEK